MRAIDTCYLLICSRSTAAFNNRALIRNRGGTQFHRRLLYATNIDGDLSGPAVSFGSWDGTASPWMV